ncbi:MAG: hypothetical protein ICV79_23495 [Flavisolibacter sp.]|nr:hypothetical protein [Flavisolibacter sp.]
MRVVNSQLPVVIHFIVISNTSNGASVATLRSEFGNAMEQVDSWQFTVDSNQLMAITFLPTNNNQ